MMENKDLAQAFAELSTPLIADAMYPLQNCPRGLRHRGFKALIPGTRFAGTGATRPALR